MELLDFINVCIEEKGDSIENELSDKPMSDYFAAFLDSKDTSDIDELVAHLVPEIKMKHAISLFCIIAKKIQDQKWSYVQISNLLFPFVVGVFFLLFPMNFNV
jgi:hypothetical protein